MYYYRLEVINKTTIVDYTVKYGLQVSQSQQTLEG